MDPILFMVVTLCLGAAWLQHRLEMGTNDPSSNSAVWVDKYGKHIPIGSMARGHLIAILSMLIREGKKNHVWYKNSKGKLRRYHARACPVLEEERGKLVIAQVRFDNMTQALLKTEAKMREKLRSKRKTKKKSK